VFAELISEKPLLNIMSIYPYIGLSPRVSNIWKKVIEGGWASDAHKRTPISEMMELLLT